MQDFLVINFYDIINLKPQGNSRGILPRMMTVSGRMPSRFILLYCHSERSEESHPEFASASPRDGFVPRNDINI
jgi:hypothetical protein